MWNRREKVEEMLKERIATSTDRREQDFWLDQLLEFRAEKELEDAAR